MIYYLQHIKSLINEATDNGQTFVKIDRKYLTITNMDLLTDKGYELELSDKFDCKISF